MKNNILKVYTNEEKENILKNAYSSFVHGVDHFVNYKEGEENIKFTIVHIFNTVELFVRAYLGQINLNLLKVNIDKDSDNDVSKRTADISLMLERMNKFSKINFDDELQEAIENLRKKRNEIEHKRFVLDNNEDVMLLLCKVISGLIVFAHDHLSLDISTDLVTGTMAKFIAIRREIDSEFCKKMKKIDNIRNRGFNIAECPYCLNLSVPYKKESEVNCFVCEKDVSILKCEHCNNLFVYSSGYPGTCDVCKEKETRDYEKSLQTYPDDDADHNSWNNLPKENYL